MTTLRPPATSSRSANWFVIDARLLALIACPDCHGTMDDESLQLRCRDCAHTYPIVDGIPLLLRNSAAGSLKESQAAFFDEETDPEFEARRPHGTPRFYRLLIEEKFERSTEQIQGLLPGSTALTVCGGSGMDAEFLARAGAFAISSDISLGATRRAVDRARRFDLDLVGIVADVEHLPFRDRSVDVVYVHDGLHHLAQPMLGLDEMARVAGRAVSVTEPARALATAAAVRVGLALDREESGNEVMRLTPAEVSAHLVEAGFDVVAARRYAMLYRHEPGRISRLFSAPGLLGLSRGALRATNAVLGGLGNKLTVQGIRT